ncbi:MAG: hypothetical protein KA010_03105 [Saprospiraceae bacterium]|nr:hypothetical protein [Saprospiraceae bacterium]
MKNFTFILLLLLFGVKSAYSQGFAWGLKGGPTMGLQKWDNAFGRNALFKYHVAAYIESLSEADDKNLFAQIGYHVKGSAIQRFPLFNSNSNTYSQYSTSYQFRNLSLMVGGKMKIPLGANKLYYSFALRGDYTLNTNLDNQEFQLNLWAPKNVFVNHFMVGLTVGGGVEIMFSELVGGCIELSISPDLSKQYNQPYAIENVISPYYPNQLTSIPSQRITNTAFEVSLGLRFLNKIKYID